VIAILIRFRMSSNRQAEAQARDSLAVARGLIEEMRSPRMLMMTQLAPANEVAMRRRQAFSEATNAISEVTRLSDDRTLAAEAIVARGDLAWSLATLPQVPGAATQPSLQVRDPKELISNASEAYRSVIEGYPEVKAAVVSARFGLAAIAENQGNWDAAKQQYEQVKSATDERDPYRILAEQRLNVLPKLREPVIMAKPATEPVAATMPAIPPLIAAPAKSSTTQSTTRPAPTTLAATVPTTQP
jgi:hypothetical protein